MGKDLLNNCISRFSIRKLNVAVCSVLLGTLVMLCTDNKVLADELTTEVQTVPLHH
ncbi:YSIRK-type signal peptide-containing protein [Streptococcus thermophilus]|uniref:YSIRK-type signal peptide-containing protein n=1 Tax=Streptococcus thermophilus TaxID=1308 RepID=UPI0015D143DB|nr:YSIRK-type signal peptide-containing protein [Streptococcus thermophilus]